MDTVVVAFISFILLLSIGFELAHHHLKETTPEAFQPILTSLYSELTLLGFIGLLMFTIFKLEILEELSKHLFGEGEEIKELGEQVHMVLFGVMALFLAQAVALAKFGEFIQRKWWRGGVHLTSMSVVSFSMLSLWKTSGPSRRVTRRWRLHETAPPRRRRRDATSDRVQREMLRAGTSGSARPS